MGWEVQGDKKKGQALDGLGGYDNRVKKAKLR